VQFIAIWNADDLLEQMRSSLQIASDNQGHKKKAAPPPDPFDECQAKQAVWLYLRSPEKLTPTEQEQLSFLKLVHPSLEIAYCLAQTFLEMVRERRSEKLEAW
jgi:hypothetical protein